MCIRDSNTAVPLEGAVYTFAPAPSVVGFACPAFLKALAIVYYPPNTTAKARISPVNAKVPLEFGSLTVLSAVGSSTVNVVS